MITPVGTPALLCALKSQGLNRTQNRSTSPHLPPLTPRPHCTSFPFCGFVILFLSSVVSSHSHLNFSSCDQRDPAPTWRDHILNLYFLFPFRNGMVARVEQLLLESFLLATSNIWMGRFRIHKDPETKVWPAVSDPTGFSSCCPPNSFWTVSKTHYNKPSPLQSYSTATLPEFSLSVNYSYLGTSVWNWEDDLGFQATDALRLLIITSWKPAMWPTMEDIQHAPMISPTWLASLEWTVLPLNSGISNVLYLHGLPIWHTLLSPCK